MSVTFTPTSSTVTVSFSAGGTFGGTYTAGQYVAYRILVNGAAANARGTYSDVGSYDGYWGEAHNTWGTCLEIPASVNANSSNTIAIQWRFESLFGGNVMYSYPGTYNEHHRSLIVR
jgi:hypothetical protein